MHQWPAHILRKTIFTYPACPQVRSERVIVEVGPGRGDFLFHLAKENPEALICGIELDPTRFDKLMRRRERFNAQNVLVVQGDARLALPTLFKSGLDAIYINFPDPWPKRKHRKNRLMQRPFVDACIPTLKENGALYFTTDDEDYAVEVAKLMATFCHPERSEGSVLVSEYDPAIVYESNESYPSYFYQLWVAQGRRIHYQKYRRL